jgi:hypothetical protein
MVARLMMNGRRNRLAGGGGGHGAAHDASATSRPASRALPQESLGVLVQDEATAPNLHKPQAPLFRQLVSGRPADAVAPAKIWNAVCAALFSARLAL